jgi:large subunit ribosomal protein L18
MKKTSKNNLRLHRKKRVRAKISGTAEKPRLAVFRSLRGIYAQIIDDNNGVTLASASSKMLKGKNSVEDAKKIGKALAEKCLEKKIKEVVFDRAGYKYHGKVKSLAEGAREGGLVF